MTRVTGHVQLVQRKHGKVWNVKYRLPSGRQVHEKLGDAWTERSRPPAGYLTRKMAEAKLAEILTDARRGLLPDTRPSGRTFREACDEYLRYVEVEKGSKPSTLIGYRSVNRTLIAEFGADTSLEKITGDRIDGYRARLLSEGELSRRSVQKLLVQLHGILKRSKRLKWIATNPAEDTERVQVRRSGDFNVLEPAQVEAAARATLTEQDAALIRVAAYTGLRSSELRALRWRDVDFARATVHVKLGRTQGGLDTPKSHKVRSVPLIDEAAAQLDALSQRSDFTDPDDLVFASDLGTARDDSDMRDAFYAALTAAKLGHLREQADPIVFHDLRHTFGTLASRVWPLTDVQAYMGHADIQTTMIYVHHVPKADAAAKLSAAIRAELGTHPPEDSVSRTVSRNAENGTQRSATEPASNAGLQLAEAA